ncbi:hypothetical protein D3C87_2037600 [compost metagenome]
MVDEMLVAGEKWLPQYSQAIEAAKQRLSAGNLIPTKEGYRGAARLNVKTVEEMKSNREAANKNARESDKGKERASSLKE